MLVKNQAPGLAARALALVTAQASGFQVGRPAGLGPQARDLGAERNLQAVNYFAGRRFWVIDADDPEGTLQPRAGSEFAQAVNATAQTP